MRKPSPIGEGSRYQDGASPEPCYLAELPAMPLRSLLMGITSFAPERHIRMYAGTIPETSTPVKAFLADIETIFERIL
jgi:hypothetical protein